MHSEDANAWTTMAATEPREVVWGNLPTPFVQHLVRQFEVYGIVFFTILFCMIPTAFTSAIIALDYLEKELSQAEGIPVQSHVVRGAARKYFYFNVFNVFLGVTIAGSLFDTLNDLINNPKLTISLLSKSL
ncbi:hypothetical protein L7F22_002556 [Adiantum nelumboides]|nr:hypothetical protein [Adiantum nelumboides]